MQKVTPTYCVCSRLKNKQPRKKIKIRLVNFSGFIHPNDSLAYEKFISNFMEISYKKQFIFPKRHQTVMVTSHDINVLLKTLNLNNTRPRNLKTLKNSIFVYITV